MALRCVTSFRTPMPRSASITSTTTAGRPTCRGFGADSRRRRRSRAICSRPRSRRWKPPAFRPRLPAILHARPSTCPHSTGCRRPPTSLASRRSSAGLHRRQRCRRRTQRMPRAPRPAGRAGTAFVDLSETHQALGHRRKCGICGRRVASGRVLVPRQPAAAAARCGGAPRRGRRRQPADRHQPPTPPARCPTAPRSPASAGSQCTRCWRPRPRRSARC